MPAAAPAQLVPIATDFEQGPPGLCWGAVITIHCTGGLCNGTAGADVIQGTAGADQIYAGGGNDIVCAGGGADTVYGGSGNDHLFGQAGADTINGEAGDDHLHGNDGADNLSGGQGDDRIYGGDGSDVISGGAGSDRLLGGTHADTIHGGADADTIYGEGGNDSIFGNGGADVVYAGQGADQVFGGPGHDQLYGQSGADTIDGEDDDDRISGGEDDDELRGGPGDDALDGDSGDDEIFGDAGDDVLFGDVGNDVCNGGRGQDEQLRDTCETLVSVELPDDDRLPGGGSLGAPCELWEQDCADGLKCVGSGIDDDFTCQPVADNPDQTGDPCDVLRQGDTCDVGSMCINGTCVALCGGTPRAPICGSVHERCHFYSDGPALCEETCDPLVYGACLDGWVCAAEQGSLEEFTCSVEQPGEAGPVTAGGACTSMMQCQQGHACIQAGALPFGYCEDGTASCCVPMCDLGEPGVCPAGMACSPFYASPPPGLEHLGVCTL